MMTRSGLDPEKQFLRPQSTCTASLGQSVDLDPTETTSCRGTWSYCQMQARHPVSVAEHVW